MDAGMSNNLPLYPLMRHDRNVDVMLILDSSADIETANWIGVAEGYARQKKVLGWPVGAGWPREGEPVQTTVQKLEQAQADSVEEAEQKVEEGQKRDIVDSHVEKKMEELAKYDHETGDQTERTEREKQARRLGYCTVWVGSKAQRDSSDEPPPSKDDAPEGPEEDWDLVRPEAGIALLYLPLIPNPKLPTINPETSPFCSTWNFEWSSQQVEDLVQLARVNFMEGEEKIRRTVRAVYERKKRERLRQEKVWKGLVERVKAGGGVGGFENGVWGFK
jgi:cytosolic phospholipase A2